MVEIIRLKVQELNIILAAEQREHRGTPQYDKYDKAMEILNGDFTKALRNDNTEVVQ